MNGNDMLRRLCLAVSVLITTVLCLTMIASCIDDGETSSASSNEQNTSFVQSTDGTELSSEEQHDISELSESENSDSLNISEDDGGEYGEFVFT